eukprot:6209741-Pleurochrysis_carterae.AAC.2
MAVGPVMDAFIARKQGVSPLRILNQNNKLLVSSLPFRTRCLFWLTNMPYWLLAVQLFLEPTPIAGTQLTNATFHALAATAIAAVSSSFHGTVLFGRRLGSGYERATIALLLGDIVVANSYGIRLRRRPENRFFYALHVDMSEHCKHRFTVGPLLLRCFSSGLMLAATVGVLRTISFLGGPIALLFISAAAKRTGAPHIYAFLHGAWHVLSATAIFQLHYRGLPVPES